MRDEFDARARAPHERWRFLLNSMCELLDASVRQSCRPRERERRFRRTGLLTWRVDLVSEITGDEKTRTARTHVRAWHTACDITSRHAARSCIARIEDESRARALGGEARRQRASRERWSRPRHDVHDPARQPAAAGARGQRRVRGCAHAIGMAGPRLSCGEPRLGPPLAVEAAFRSAPVATLPPPA